MKAGDKEELGYARNIVAAFVNELLAKRKKPGEFLDDESALAVLSRVGKQRKDSIEQFRGGGREDLVAAEEKELAYISKFLPALMGRDEIKKSAEAKKAGLGITDKREMGKLMAALMKDLKGKADGGDVKAVVEELFL